MKPKAKFYRRKIEVSTENGEVARYYSDLMYFKFKDSYCWLYFSGGDKYLVEMSLKNQLKKLPEKPFFRCNRTEVINLCYYAAYIENPATVVLENGNEFNLSVRPNKGFKKKMDSLKDFSLPCPNCSDCKKGSCRRYWLFTIETDSANNETE